MSAHILSNASIPTTFMQLVGRKVTSSFRDAVAAEKVPLVKPGPNQLLVKNRFVGINASDLNITAGRYETKPKIPYLVGIEAVAQVVEVGEDCPPWVNKAVAYMSIGAFSEYKLIDYKYVFPLPSLDRHYLPFLVSGLTASICLEKTGEIKSGETVLVTAAAGGTGHIAVQLAKNKGCHVISTCSTDEKAAYLKTIGCDRPVVYTKEDLHTVLQNEYPKGVDVVYESVGGKIFDVCLRNIANGGRIIIIGFIESYEAEGRLQPSDEVVAALRRIPATLLMKSASLRGFLLHHFAKDYAEHFQKLIELYTSGKLHTTVDMGETSTAGPFLGLDSVYDAVDYMFSKKSVGKVIVELNRGE